eukprot:INCI11156.1.p1 GENE.INCI11156.1~~INCI11156.1.p1  ORF type:complete len:482 (-),score=115.86 INCI11156.1:70-1515(-)
MASTTQAVKTEPKRTPLRTGRLSLLSGLFKLPTKRVVTLWGDKLVFSAPNKFDKVGGYIRTEHAHVSSGERKNHFVVRDRSSRTDFVFVATDGTEASEWSQSLKEAIEARLLAQRDALANEKARMDAIAERLGVNAIGSPKATAEDPKESEKMAEAKALQEAAAEVVDALHTVAPDVEKAESDDETPERAALKQRLAILEKQVAEKEASQKVEKTAKTELSQDVINAAAACGVLASTLTSSNSSNNSNTSRGGRPQQRPDRGSGTGRVRLDGDVYWYEVGPSDTLAGVCLHFDASETQVRRANYLSKQSIDGLKVVRIPRHLTGDPSYDYSGDGSTGHDGGGGPSSRQAEDAEAKRLRTQEFKIHIMVLLSAQRALKEEDCFSKTEALAYLNLHDHDLNKALDAMEQDKEWDEKYGYLLRRKRENLAKERSRGSRAGSGADLAQVKVDGLVPNAIELKSMAASPAPIGVDDVVIGTPVRAQ